MANPFEIEIGNARKQKQRRGVALVSTFFVLLLILTVSYLYISTVKFEVALKDYQSEIQLNVVNGNAIKISSYRVLLISGNADIKVNAAGYQAETIQLSDQDRISKVKVALDYAFVEVQLSTVEELSNPLWYLDGALVSSGTELNMNKKPGVYQLELFSDHHESVTLPLRFDPAENLMQQIEVKRKIIRFSIETKPGGAGVYIDDQFVGRTPAVGEISSAVVRVEARMDGYESAVEELDLSQIDGLLKRKYRLKPAKNDVAVSFQPLGGRVYVDGSEKPLSNRLSIKATGIANIRYSKKGYESQVIRADRKSRSVSFNLKPIFGRLTLTSDPAAIITVGVTSYGVTPLDIELQATDQVITFSRVGYSPKKIPVEVIADKNQLLDVRLQSWSEHYLSQSQERMTNKAGVKLIRFFPQAFKMGAPRSQQGQRANELLRSVEFSRAIYMSEHEVTEHQYGLYASAVPSTQKPVTNVSWSDAVLFCNWLSLEEGLQPFYKTQGDLVIGVDAASRGYRLPSEAEWEYVARYANKKSPTIFAWGDKYEITHRAGNVADESAKGSVRTYINGYKDGHKQRADVGSFAREESGLFDMSGNVSEWVHDVYSIELPNSKTSYSDFLGAHRGNQHVVKGSNYMSSVWAEFRPSFKETSDGPRADVGFRVARYIN